MFSGIDSSPIEELKQLISLTAKDKDFSLLVSHRRSMTQLTTTREEITGYYALFTFLSLREPRESSYKCASCNGARRGDYCSGSLINITLDIFFIFLKT